MKIFFGAVLGLSLVARALAQESPSSSPTSAPSSQPAQEAANALTPESAPASAPASTPIFPAPELMPPLTPKIPWRSNPSTATSLALVPGLGHAYLGRYGQASGYAGSMVGLYFVLQGATLAGAPGDVLRIGMQNLWFYNIFDAYRDARLKRKDVGYVHPITKESLGQLALAPFHPKVLRKKWVWAGVPAALAGGIGVSLLAERVLPEAQFSLASLRPTPKVLPKLAPKLSAEINADDAGLLAVGSLLFAATFVPVGVGEEALFRGSLQASLAERMGETPGWITASLIFGAVHIGNFLEIDPATGKVTGFNEAGYFAVPYITLVGLGFGYIYKEEGYQLSAGVAAHFWYDFLLSVPSLFLLADQEPAMLRFSFSW